MADTTAEEAVENVETPAEDEESPPDGEQAEEEEQGEEGEQSPTEEAAVNENNDDEDCYDEGSVEECPSEIESIDSTTREAAMICDPDLKQNFLNHAALLKEINTQNKIILQIKQDIQKICCKSHRSSCDKRDICALRTCFEEENKRLSCLMQKAIELQSKDPDRKYANINLETSFVEDMMSVKTYTSAGLRSTSKFQSTSDLKRLQEALNKLQKSIETIKGKMRDLRNGTGGDENDAAQNRKLERLQSACDFLRNVEGRCNETKPTTDVDEGMCGDRDDTERLQCVINQQSVLLEEYSLKFVKVQKKVCDQTDIINKLETRSKVMEDEINNEVDKIKSKFIEKINDLADYPTLLEKERKKIAKFSKDKEAMECRLRTLCKQLRKLKAQKNEENFNYEKEDPTIAENQKEELKKLKEWHYRLLGEMEKATTDREILTADLDAAILELETLRCDSVKNISKEKGLSGCIRQTFQDLIAKTEKELAQCKATSCLSVAERDETIKEMRKQLNTLVFSFDAAQKEIQCLKHKIFNVAKDSNKPVECDP